ncbi:nicotinamide mononucleotide transporter [Pedobacter sp. UYEF25]
MAIVKEMDFQHWFELFKTQILQTSWLEGFAVGFGVAEVLLAKRNNIWLYPTGILSVVLSMYLLLNVQLYAETLLNIYYLVMSIYGWIIWKKTKAAGAMQVSYASKNELLIAISISAFGFILLYLILRHFTNSDVPIWDAFVSATAWAGMWLLAKRKIENWIFLNISNLVAIPLLLHKHLAMFAVLTIVLFIVAIFGFLDWKKIINKKEKNSA